LPPAKIPDDGSPTKTIEELPKKKPPKLPADIVMPCNVMTAKFIAANSSVREEIEDKLSEQRCEVIWPDVSKSSDVVLHCTVDVMHDDDDKVLVNWTRVCSKIYEKCVRAIKCDTMKISPDIWDAFMSEFLVMELEDEDLLIEHADHVLQYAGLDKTVRRFRMHADFLVKRLLSCVPQIAQHTVDLRNYEITLLKMCQFVEECKKRYQSSKTEFKVSLSSSAVAFNGLSTDVEDAKVDLYVSVLV